MTTHVLQFVEFTDQDRKVAQPFGNLGKGDRVEIRVRQSPAKITSSGCRRRPQSCSRPLLAIFFRADGSLSSPRTGSSVRTTRQVSWAFPAPSSCTAWRSAICRSDMSASTVARS